PIYFRLGHEFMPPLNEGVILYMPTTLPGISVTEASALLQKQDALLRQVPEVERVFGKAGRADTSTDPAPLSMMETTVVLKPEAQWRAKPRWYSSWMPSFLLPLVRPLWPDRMSWEELTNDLDQRLQLPGQTNAWTTIEARERYPINIRYPRELRDEMDKLGRVLVPTPSGAQIPLAQLATLRIVEGPAMIRDENGKLAGYVYIDVDTVRRDLGSFVDDAKRAVAAQLRMPAGYTLQWSGQYEAMERVRQRMIIVVPLTLFVVAF